MVPKPVSRTGFTCMLCVNEGGSAQFLCPVLNSAAQGFAASAMNHHLHPHRYLALCGEQGQSACFSQFPSLFGVLSGDAPMSMSRRHNCCQIKKMPNKPHIKLAQGKKILFSEDSNATPV